jgi:hypothetical protein
VDILSGLQSRHPALWRGLGNLESRLLAESMQTITIERPIYISGLARSGTTILLELLARHPQLSTHRYRDFPPLHTPWLWNWFVDRAGRRDELPAERAHGDGIDVTSESPEAFEEVIWMAFFPDLHNPDKSSVLTARDSNHVFERFYRDHIRKLLLVRGGQRYLSKANYNLTRLSYLLRLFPDASFILPVREPVSQIASLINQHTRFCREHARDARLQRHMSRCGHFEFGLDRSPINCGNMQLIREIRQLWSEGYELEGWALYWRQLYGYVADLLEEDAAIRNATLLVDYEVLCNKPEQVMNALVSHCKLPSDQFDLAQEAAATIRHAPSSRPCFSEAQQQYIEQVTSPVTNRLQQFYPPGLSTG